MLPIVIMGGGLGREGQGRGGGAGATATWAPLDGWESRCQDPGAGVYGFARVEFYTEILRRAIQEISLSETGHQE